jgi:hypothetical protein
VGLFVQLGKCLAWVLFGLLLGFVPPTEFYCLLSGIRILGVSFGFAFFLFLFFLQEILGMDVQHANMHLRLKDIQVAFGILF